MNAIALLLALTIAAPNPSLATCSSTVADAELVRALTLGEEAELRLTAEEKKTAALSRALADRPSVAVTPGWIPYALASSFVVGAVAGVFGTLAVVKAIRE